MDSPPRVIVLDEVTLRRFDPRADVAELDRVIGEAREHLRPWMDWVVGHRLASTVDFLARREAAWEAGREFTYAIVLDGAIRGACQLFRREDGPAGGREVGYWLHPAAVGRGVATRSARALVEQAFRLPGVDFVEIGHDAANRASGAVAARLGFTEHRRSPTGAGEHLVWRLTRRQAEWARGVAQEDLRLSAPEVRGSHRPEPEDLSSASDPDRDQSMCARTVRPM
ncbi:GNAT family N-acetyltransferase [Kitasatospora sp. NPDC093806]|uniref:GNAT family N-acetyltransferase n=1 Tax=Kitasatospora sp. NPDC093806 TaxID=3155075 RepID=UPI00343B5545